LKKLCKHCYNLYYYNYGNHRCVNVVAEPELKSVRADFVSNLGAEANPYSHWDDLQEKDRTSTVNFSQLPQSDIPSIRAKLLIAADGINSTVRQVIYKDTPYSLYSKPEYSGVVAIASGGVYEIPEALSQEILDLFLQGSRLDAGTRGRGDGEINTPRNKNKSAQF